MKRIFSFALGNIWRWSKNRNKLISYAKQLDVSGVELTFAYKEELYLFKISEDNKNWLKQLDYVTIHAPFRFVQEAENEEGITKQLDCITELYNDIDAKNVIFHPTDLPLEELITYSFKVSTENLAPKANVKIEELKKILDKHPNIGLCLDVAHAYLWSKHETSNLVKTFEDKISQIHLSGTYRRKDHQSLRKVSKDFLYSIEPIKELDVPIVIEEDVEVKSLKYLREEIEYIKRVFD